MNEETKIVPGPSEFLRIRKAAEEALEAFLHSGISDAYNAGDLGVKDVAWCFHEDGDSQWVITIEEASPEAYKLQGFVGSVLARNGIPCIILTEW